MNRARGQWLAYVLLGVCLLGSSGHAKAHSLESGFAVANASQEGEEGRGARFEGFFKWINFLLLVGGLAYLLRKPLRDFFAQRSESIRRSLEEGRKALEASQAQLGAVEEKLRHLEEEISAFKASATREMEEERERLRKAAGEEAEKILAFARAQMEAATRAAKIELKAYTAQEALKLAEQIIRERLDDAGRQRLVSQFIAKLEVKENKN